MEDKTTKKYVAAFIVGSIFILTLTAHKYNSLKAAYERAEQDKVEYCEKYHELCKDTAATNLLQKDYYELWEENQRFSSMLSEIENEPGGHEILEKLWSNYEK
jgi:hypothetical protein